MNESLLIAGGSSGTHIGASFLRAAGRMKKESHLLNTAEAYGQNPLWSKFNWWVMGRQPDRLSAFSRRLLGECRRLRPTAVLTTGLAPVTAGVLVCLKAEGIKVVNYLTDDPWNKSFSSGWFFKSLTEYEIVFTPRRANIDDLQKLGCRNVNYLPFGFDKEYFYPCPVNPRLESDILFAGGADSDRAPLLGALSQAGFRIALYGSYWERFQQTRTMTRGQADIATLRAATASTKMALCLVRRANRDGHSMRTFEIPAVGAFMLTEDTAEHRDLFGGEGIRTLYFKNDAELVAKARWALEHEADRKRMAAAAERLVMTGAHTYEDRLRFMLSKIETPV